jgi:uncharacterized protein YqgC (DUF456 family)
VTTIFVAIALTVVNILGAVVTFVGLPGHWVMIALALVVQLWRDQFLWYTIAAAIAVGVLAEVVEFLAGAAGAKMAGSSRRAAWAAIAGGLVGAILGTFVLAFIPLLGTVIGAALGAAVAAIAFEMTLIDRRQLTHLSKLGVATAVSRFAALLLKGILACFIALMLTIDAFVGA